MATPLPAAGAAFAFSRLLRVGEADSVPRLFATLPYGASYAHRMAPVMATGALIASVESVCVLEMQERLGPGETVVGTHVELHHCGPALPGSLLVVRGHAEPRDGGTARFTVIVESENETVATARLTFAVLCMARYAARLERSLGRNQRVAQAPPEHARCGG